MRVTESIMYSRMQRQVSAAQSRYDASSLPLLTGQKHARPSEDTAWALEVRQLESGKAQVQQQRETVARLDAYYGQTEISVENAVSLLQDMGARALQMRNDSYSAADRATAAKEVANAIDALRAQANAKVGDRYVFSGRSESTAPFDADGNYVGDPQGRMIAVASGTELSGDLTGDTVFGESGAADNAFVALQKLQAALEANDTSALDDAITAVHGATTRATAAWSKVGGIRNNLAGIADLHEDSILSYDKRLSTVGGTDIAAAATQLKAAEDAFSATLATAQRISDLLSKHLQF